MKKSTRMLVFFPALLFTARFGLAQNVYQSISIIGPAASGWTTDVPLNHASTTNLHQWTLTMRFNADDFKFRTTNDWAVNWGAAAFPAGTGVSNGPNITVSPAGVYKVTFDDTTGAYQFTAATLATTPSRATTLQLAAAPNPTQGGVRLVYELPAAATITLSVHNALGQLVRQLPPVRQAAGSQVQQLPELGLAPGVYLVQLQADDQRQTTRLLMN